MHNASQIRTMIRYLRMLGLKPEQWWQSQAIRACRMGSSWHEGNDVAKALREAKDD